MCLYLCLHGDQCRMHVQILDAVRYVHSKGMMHRDLKPSNIFFSLEGNIKVGDFGLVTSTTYGGLHNSYLALKGLVGPGGEEQGHRQHTGNLGTHLYMSPEQVSGKKYDHKVDIYSLGVIFFELHYPFSTDMERAKVVVGPLPCVAVFDVVLSTGLGRCAAAQVPLHI